MQSSLASAMGQLANSKGKNDQLRGTISSMKGTIEGFKNKISGLNKSNGMQQKNIAALSSSIKKCEVDSHKKDKLIVDKNRQIQFQNPPEVLVEAP